METLSSGTLYSRSTAGARESRAMVTLSSSTYPVTSTRSRRLRSSGGMSGSQRAVVTTRTRERSNGTSKKRSRKWRRVAASVSVFSRDARVADQLPPAVSVVDPALGQLPPMASSSSRTRTNSDCPSRSTAPMISPGAWALPNNSSGDPRRSSRIVALGSPSSSAIWRAM